MISKKFVVAIFLLMTFTQAFGQETICSYVVKDGRSILHPDGSHTVAVIFVLNYQGTPSDAEKSLVASLKESIAKIR